MKKYENNTQHLGEIVKDAPTQKTSPAGAVLTALGYCAWGAGIAIYGTCYYICKLVTRK